MGSQGRRRCDHFHENCSGVIAAGVLHRGGDKTLGERFAGGVVLRAAADFFQLTIPQAIDQAVGADEKTVACAMSDGPDLRFDKLVAGPECLLKRGATRIGSGFALVHDAFAPLNADVAVIVAYLGDPTFSGEIINPAVADVSKIHPLRREPAEAERATHAGAFLIGKTQLKQIGVDGGEEFKKNILETARYAGGQKSKAARQQAGDAIDRDPTCDLARVGATHAIADRENEIVAGERGVADFAEITNFTAVEIEREKCVFVIRPKAADVRERRPAEERE